MCVVLMVSWFGLLYVIVHVPGHTHFFAATVIQEPFILNGTETLNGDA